MVRRGREEIGKAVGAMLMPENVGAGEESAGEVPPISIPPPPPSSQTESSARIGDSTDDEEAERAFDVALVRRMGDQLTRNAESAAVRRLYPVV